MTALFQRNTIFKFIYFFFLKSPYEVDASRGKILVLCFVFGEFVSELTKMLSQYVERRK